MFFVTAPYTAQAAKGVPGERPVGTARSQEAQQHRETATTRCFMSYVFENAITNRAFSDNLFSSKTQKIIKNELYKHTNDTEMHPPATDR